MKNNKIMALALLLAMGLSPVNSQVSYAEGDAANQPGTQSEGSFSVEDFIDKKVEEVRQSKAYLISTDTEINAFEEAINKIKEESKDLNEDNKEEIRDKIESSKEGLGVSVIYAKPLRARIDLLVQVLEEREEKEAIERAKALTDDKNTSAEALENELASLHKLVGGYNEFTTDGTFSSLAAYPNNIVIDDYSRDYEELVNEKDGLLAYGVRVEDKLETLSDKSLVQNYLNTKKSLENNSGEDINSLDAVLKAYDKATFDIEKAIDKELAQKNKQNETPNQGDGQGDSGKGTNKDGQENQGENNKETDIDKLINNEEFIGSSTYKKTSKTYKKAYDDAHKDLKASKEALEKAKAEGKSEEEINKAEKKLEDAKKALEKAKKDIEDNSFDAKLAELIKKISEPEDKKVTDDELKNIQKLYNKKLDDIKNKEDATLDDLIKFEKEELPVFYKLINKEVVIDASDIEDEENKGSGSNGTKGNKNTVAKKVTTKKSKGKVRTGVESILPIAGGVAVVAAIALFLTRKKK